MLLKLMYKNKSNILLFTAIILLFNSSIYGQNLFTTRNGAVSITFKYEETIIMAKSSNVRIKLDYSTATADLIADVNSIVTGVDSLDEFLKQSDKTLHFYATLNLDYIDTKRHPKQSFAFNGTLYHYINKSFLRKKIATLEGKGNLEHLSEKTNIPACLLTLNFELNPNELKFSYPYSFMKEFIKVEIIQAVLKSKQL